MMFYDRLTLFSPHLMPNSNQSFDDMSCLSFEKQRNVYALTQRILTVWIDWKCVVVVDDWIALLARAESGSGSVMLNPHFTECVKKTNQQWPVTHRNTPLACQPLCIWSVWVKCQFTAKS